MRSRTQALLALLAPPLVTSATCIVLGVSAASAFAWSIVAIFASCDGWYFVRLASSSVQYWLDDVVARAPSRKLFDVSTLDGRVRLNDIDRNGHCNNARFLRECGFGRRDLWHYNGVWKIITSAGGNLVVGAQTVRYRRELSLHREYTLATRVLCWDDRAFYVEHRFVTRSNEASSNHTAVPFVNAIVLVKNNVLGKLKPAQIIAQLQRLDVSEVKSPPMPPDIAALCESNSLSSSALRNESKHGT
ncbi:TPA: hypothetical protein N0F65_006255 [Lagenidium giganteum]|uniref:Uncharacterized protein n=1 Tax=Lagenidium giganteum TaxID=4803 RepID=A0AAV2Z612_9STRA|nr:TPA: hypothetical protein N0F65_006255 [Lagenidium giganteum]